MTRQRDSRFELPDSFPQSDYTPFGYIDNPQHTAVLNPSGVLRTVPPMGMGFWVRALPWPYGSALDRKLNCLSFLHLSLVIEGQVFHSVEDFEQRGVQLVSRYHTKHLLSYDWTFEGVQVSAKYALLDEHALLCNLELMNTTGEAKTCTVHATNIYGFPERRYWGCDGVRSIYSPVDDVGIAKVWAYGDVFALGAERQSSAFRATASDDEWRHWISSTNLSQNDGALVRFTREVFRRDADASRNEPPTEQQLQDHVNTVMSYNLSLPAGESEVLLLCLARGVNEINAVKALRGGLQHGRVTVAQQLCADDAFYQRAPILEGDWHPHWKHGWVYDLETIRMTIRPPVGIFRHPWDGMQIHSPRSVLGETSLDVLCLSYADIHLAKEVIYGTFADAPMPNIPCTREDGSMNMISENASECGTAPNWGFPFLVIASIFARDRDIGWLRDLFPYLERFLAWWMENRADDQGWFHADCSWESGQDGSERFRVSGDTPGASTVDVRTVDIEASMAHAYQAMTYFAGILEKGDQVAHWEGLAAEAVRRVRSMYVDGWFRDFDASQETPIILDNYFDVMMFSPLTLGLATAEQIDGVRDKFQYFIDHPKHWLEWPSFMLPYTEAAWNAGLRSLAADVIAMTADRIYARTDGRALNFHTGRMSTGLPQQFNYRIPGVATEFWPLTLEDNPNPGGCENYGWGATMPTLILRSVIGFREAAASDAEAFILAPALPASLLVAGKRFGCRNLHYRGHIFDVDYAVLETGELDVTLTWRSAADRTVSIVDERGNPVAGERVSNASAVMTCRMTNGGLYRVLLTE